MGKDESKLSFLRTLRFYNALAIFEPQIYVVVEQFGAESISLLSGCLVTKTSEFLLFHFQSFSDKFAPSLDTAYVPNVILMMVFCLNFQVKHQAVSNKFSQAVFTV